MQSRDFAPTESGFFYFENGANGALTATLDVTGAGRLDRASVVEAARRTRSRHAMLRVRSTQRTDDVWQLVDDCERDVERMVTYERFDSNAAAQTERVQQLVADSNERCATTAPLVEFSLIASDDAATVVVYLMHTISDLQGLVVTTMDFVQALDDVLAGRDAPATDPLAYADSIPPPLSKTLSWYLQSWWHILWQLTTLRRYMLVVKSLLTSGLSFSTASERETHKIEPSLSRTASLVYTLPLEPLLAKCRANGTTVQGALVSAYTHALVRSRIEEKVSLTTSSPSSSVLAVPLSTTVDARRHLPSPLPARTVAYWSSGITDSVDVDCAPLRSSDTPTASAFWSVARDARAHITDFVVNHRFGGLTAFLDWLGYPTMRNIARGFESNPFSMTIANVGSVRPVAPLTHLRVAPNTPLNAYHGLASMRDFALSLVTGFNGILSIVVCFPSPAVDATRIERLMSHAIRYLEVL